MDEEFEKVYALLMAYLITGVMDKYLDSYNNLVRLMVDNHYVGYVFDSDAFNYVRFREVFRTQFIYYKQQ